MQLLVPEGGSILDTVFSSSSMDIFDGGHQGVDGPSDQDLTDALAALRAGWIEYVILQDGDEFLQVAGEGDGPYLVQLCPGDPDQMLTASPVRFGDVVPLFGSYLRGDGAWRQLAGWSGGGGQATGRTSPRSGFLGRLLGRD